MKAVEGLHNCNVGGTVVQRRQEHDKVARLSRRAFATNAFRLQRHTKLWRQPQWMREVGFKE